MKCIDVKENLDALLDGEAGISNGREIENHLETCDDCRLKFENLNTMSGVLKQNLAVSAPAILDQKIFKQFDNFHAEKPKPAKEKIGWFAIPRFAFAAALVLFALGITSAYQIGKISATEISVVMPEVQEGKSLENSPNTDFAENKQPNVENTETTNIIEVPVIREKNIEVPVIKEKIVTRIVYKEKDEAIEKETALRNNSQNDENVGRANIDKFQLVSELRPKIIKKGATNDE